MNVFDVYVLMERNFKSVYAPKRYHLFAPDGTHDHSMLYLRLRDGRQNRDNVFRHSAFHCRHVSIQTALWLYSKYV